MNTVTCKAYGKINLSLDVTGRREDGYHLVRMVMQTVNVCDTITVEPSGTSDITVATDNSDIPSGPDNLVWKAADVMRRNFGIREGFIIHLKKRIPVAAGMAGGSADAAAVMRAICRMTGITADPKTLERLALPLGADIPYCLTGGTQLAEGIGEQLTRLPAAPCAEGNSVVIVKPSLFISTGKVYSMFDRIPGNEVLHPDVDAQVQAIRQQDAVAMAAACRNVLEQETGAAYPVIGELEQFFLSHGAMQAMMTGSGPTVFALFDGQEKAAAAYAQLQLKKTYAGFEKYLTRFCDPD